ncbi:transcription factor bHLH19-like [Hibiscus syriacus]|uniref:transcription factor bHLH19-like n=1 Tax=Hibiscus syriacus TaxID=106335 RepID=UPI001922FB3D|nr:transcription factor bHLH19-like [Hibiscus syriacus]
MEMGVMFDLQKMENPLFFAQYQTMNPFDDMGFESESYYSSINDEAFHHQAVDDFEKPPLKQVKFNKWNHPTMASSCSSSSHIISFQHSNSSPPVISRQYYGLDRDLQPAGNTRTPLHAQEHVIAERKRREKIAQSFLSLSALITGLKKVQFPTLYMKITVIC